MMHGSFKSRHFCAVSGAARAKARGSLPARGAVLLEVIVAMGLLIFGMAVVGLQINAGFDAARSADIATRAVLLADTKMAELSSGILRPETNDDELTGDFGAMFPGYSWRVLIERTDLDVFNMITLEIGFNRNEMEAQIDNPELELEIDDRGTRIVHTAYRLMPIPADVDLARDFGLTEEELARLQDAMSGGQIPDGSSEGKTNENQHGPGGESGQPGGGAGGGDIGSLNDLIANLGSLGDLKSFDPRMLAALPEEEFTKIATLLEALLGRGNGAAGSPDEALANLLKESGKTGGGGGGGEGGTNTGNQNSTGGGEQNRSPGGSTTGDNRSPGGSSSDSGSNAGSSDGGSDSGDGRRGRERRSSRRGRGGNSDDSASSSDGKGGDSAGSGGGSNSDSGDSGGSRARNRRGREGGSGDSGTDSGGSRARDRRGPDGEGNDSGSDSNSGERRGTRREREQEGGRDTGNSARDQDNQSNNAEQDGQTSEEEDPPPRRRSRRSR